MTATRRKLDLAPHISSASPAYQGLMGCTSNPTTFLHAVTAKSPNISASLRHSSTAYSSPYPSQQPFPRHPLILRYASHIPPFSRWKREQELAEENQKRDAQVLANAAKANMKPYMSGRGMLNHPADSNRDFRDFSCCPLGGVDAGYGVEIRRRSYFLKASHIEDALKYTPSTSQYPWKETVCSQDLGLGTVTIVYR